MEKESEKTDEGEAAEPPDEPPCRTADEKHGEEEENAELEWARRHIREESVPRTGPEKKRDSGPGAQPKPEAEEESGKDDLVLPAKRGKGRPPHRMLKEAVAIAKKRGGVILVPGGRSDSFDLIICEEFRTVFIRLRWSGTQYLSSRDVPGRYPRDIGRILRLPLTGVIAFEVWLREPQDMWQHFLVLHDGLVEIREDGTLYYRPVLPVPVADEAASAPEDEGPAGEGGPGPDQRG